MEATKEVRIERETRGLGKGICKCMCEYVCTSNKCTCTCKISETKVRIRMGICGAPDRIDSWMCGGLSMGVRIGILNKYVYIMMK